jgi:hypothetical protein
MKAATQRAILRWIHLVFTIPLLGYVYSKPSEVEQYVGGVRYIFAPVLILSGYWMYSGMIFGIVGVALWLGAYRVGGFGAALLSQVVLLIVRKIWFVVDARRAKTQGIAN